MLLCSVDDLEPGMEVGGVVLHPRRPQTELLRPGAKLERKMIDYLHRIGIGEIWIQHDATADLDAAVAPALTTARTELYQKLKNDFGALASATVSTTRVQVYRQSIIELVFALIRSGKYAHTCHQLLKDSSHIFTHSANVAFLSLLVGLEMETYVVRQRPRLSPDHARDVVPLGLGAMLHDIGKHDLADEARKHHEIHPVPEDPDVGQAYAGHPENGYHMLLDVRLPATARHAVLNHHQRFDGSGWPDRVIATRGRQEGPQSGTGIHIFSRIISAANVFDNLMTTADGDKRPTIAALCEFAGGRFDGWFDPLISDLMIRRVPPFPIGSQVRLSNGWQGAVVGLNFQQPCRPSVRILDDRCRTRGGDLRLIDLEAARELHVVECAGALVEKYLFELPTLRPHGDFRTEPDTRAESA
ncbi:MAG: HD domain-containing protein [Phycisphaerales bacterium]|nr:MAG: HD domain-containing protein [Phycisphaerales bacterium]